MVMLLNFLFLENEEMTFYAKFLAPQKYRTTTNRNLSEAGTKKNGLRRSPRNSTSTFLVLFYNASADFDQIGFMGTAALGDDAPQFLIPNYRNYKSYSTIPQREPRRRRHVQERYVM